MEPFGITQFFTDGWGAYQGQLDQQAHIIGKPNTQTIGRKHLTLRTRIKHLARNTICFSKSIEIHDLVIGLFISSGSNEEHPDSDEKSRIVAALKQSK